MSFPSNAFVDNSIALTFVVALVMNLVLPHRDDVQQEPQAQEGQDEPQTQEEVSSKAPVVPAAADNSQTGKGAQSSDASQEDTH